MTRKASVPDRLRRQVQERAQGRCEYCLIHELDMYYPHEPDHVIAEKHGGSTSFENLAWSCFYCNRFKGSDLASIDPASGKAVFLFHPREQNGIVIFASMALLLKALPQAVVRLPLFFI